MDVQSRHATRAGAVSERPPPSYLSLVTSGGRCTPCAAATLCTCWRFHGVRSCGISGPPPVPRASTRSVPRVRTHSVHPFTGATTISHHSPRREYHHHLGESTTTTAPAITAVTSTVTTPRPPPYSDHGAAQYHHGMYHVRGIQGRVRRGQRTTAAAEPLASPQLLSTELAGGSRSEMGNMMRKCADATVRSEFPTPMDSGAGGGRLVNAAKGPRPGTGPGRPRAMPRARAGGEILAAGDRPCVRA